MKYILFGFIFALSAFILLQCKTQSASINYLGEIPYPDDNKYDSGRVELGKMLFFDPELSSDGTIACSSCHRPGLAFSDGKEVSDGVNGQHTTRNSPSILNSAYLKRVMFDGELKNLEMQAIVPIQEHTEMNMPIGTLIEKLRKDETYQKLAKKLYGRDFDAYVLTRSIAAFERTLLSNNSPFDQFYFGKKKNAISKRAKEGWKLFSEKLYCTQCHPAPQFTTFEVANNGYTDPKAADQGRFRIHGDTADMGMFKIPSLRNLTETGPYMHDGKLKSIDEVLAHYMKGGNQHRNKDKRIQAFQLTLKEIQALKSFFNTLNHNSYFD